MSQRLASAVLACGILALFALASSASAATFTCGQTLTTSITLDADVSCPDIASNAPLLRIGANGVTVDLNGHKVSGHGLGIVNDGYDHVTVRNGTIAGNHFLVLFSNVRWNTLSKLTLQGIVDGLRIDGGAHNLISDNSIQGVTFGVRSSRTWVANNDTVGWEGSLGVSGDHNVIAGNTTHGGALHVGGSHDYVAGNHVTADPLGSTLDGLTDSKFLDNVIVGYGHSPALAVFEASRNVLRGNALFGGGLLLQSGVDNLLRRNVAYGAKGSSPDGFVIEAGVTGTQLINNLASTNADDGFDVRAPGTVLTRNKGNDNGAFGIRAVGGVVDGGGNTATGNGNLAQCSGIACN